MMKRKFYRSLRFEITVSLALVLAAAVGFMGLVVLQYSHREMLALKVETGWVLARLMEERMSLPDPARGLQMMAIEYSGAGFERIVILDRNGKIITATGQWPWTESPNRNDLERAMRTREARTFIQQPRFPTFDEKVTLALAVPLFKGPRVIGVVGLYSTLPQMRVGFRRLKGIIFIYLLVDAAIMVLFGSYLLSRRFLQPLARMVERVRSLEAGEYKPGQEVVTRDNEIGQLEVSFESMASSLLESRANLEENLVSLQQAQEDLIRSEKMASVGRLSAGLAHELGNPLGSLLGFLHLLRQTGLSDQDRSEYLRRMEAELIRMDGIIRSLLDFARPVGTKIEPVDLTRVVNDALALAKVQKWFAGLDVKVDIQPDLPNVRGDANRLVQVMLNLLANAGQAMAGSGSLIISASTRQTGVRLQVADNGPGIASRDLPHIFEPFFTTKEPGRGTGLGLSVSLGIVEMLGGRLEVESTPGEKTVFSIFLPLEKETVEL